MSKEKVFLYVGPPQLAHYCKLTFRQLLCWGPAIIEKFVIGVFSFG
ncbi:hypothetical protein DB727_13155 [Staphylococcus aureus]|nr:hypothetical protein A3Q31_01320 [Staphylococcus aureus]OXE91151.1 hypothetical protein WM61_01995 [Staphylococcus aureus]PAJ10430.1 hypothetical protein APW95_05095 [Staphylococcus aureus]PAJ22275.1 hypothetical protein APW30_11235 [Staphylococcus aureus]PHS91376.1 hypothetical protein AB877_13915 [Staphylococcus aureus]